MIWLALIAAIDVNAIALVWYFVISVWVCMFDKLWCDDRRVTCQCQLRSASYEICCRIIENCLMFPTKTWNVIEEWWLNNINSRTCLLLIRSPTLHFLCCFHCWPKDAGKVGRMKEDRTALRYHKCWCKSYSCGHIPDRLQSLINPSLVVIFHERPHCHYELFC